VHAVQTDIGAQLTVDTSWSALNTAWQAVKTSASADNLDKLTDTLNEHIGRVSDQSNLTLDPDIDTYYLMDAVTVKWPNWLIRATRSNALLERSASQPLSAKDHDIAVELRILLDDALSGMQDDFAKATAYNPQLKTVLNSRQEQLLNQAKPMACNWTRPSAVRQQLQAACKTGPYKVRSHCSSYTDQLESLLHVRLSHIQLQRNIYGLRPVLPAAVGLSVCRPVHVHHHAIGRQPVLCAKSGATDCQRQAGYRHTTAR
jgi:methyl-accepting chemotaxis protein